MIHHFPWLTLIIFLPLAGGLLALGFTRRPTFCRFTSLVTAVLDLLLVVCLFTLGLKAGSWPTGSWLLAEDLPWVESLGIRYSLGLDGISLMLVLLTAFLTVLCV